jgi:hypothetical protein
MRVPKFSHAIFERLIFLEKKSDLEAKALYRQLQ